MTDRLSLQTFLETLLGSSNVYFQPPESVIMKYPAFVYSLDNINNTHANNLVYNSRDRYSVMYITKNPDDDLIRKVSSLPLCSFDRHYKSDNLNHYVYTMYYYKED